MIRVPQAQPRIAILGAGNMGSALAHVLALQGAPVAVWDFFPEVVREIREQRTNRRFLPGVSLDPRIHATPDPGECVRGAGIVLLCVPSVFTGPTLLPLAGALEEGAVILNVAKGFSTEGPEILPLWVESRLGHPCAHLAGPALANEFAQGRPSFVVVAARMRETAKAVAEALQGPILFPSVTTDLQGAALGGIIKNSYAIFMGILQGLGVCGRNVEAAALTLCGQEMESLLLSFGADSQTVRGLSGVGDLVATCLAPDSHNRRLGTQLAGGRKLEDIRSETGWLPEGARSTPVLLRLAGEAGSSPPILRYLGRVLDGEAPEAGPIMNALHHASGSCGR